MKAALYTAPGYIEVIEKQLSLPIEKELCVKIDTCGICGTDFHIFHGTAHAKTNIVLGHEISGVITEMGRECYEFAIGDKVVIDPNIYCGYCSRCKEGKVHFCENHKAIGVTQDGGFAEYVIIPSKQAYKIPANFPLNLAVFAEPLSCCIRGIDLAEIKIGENVVIIGCGAIGLMMLQLAKLSGAAKVIVIEPSQMRCELALQFGADFVFNPSDPNLLLSIMEITNGGADAVIECAGKPVAIETGISLAKRGGRIVIFGLSPLNSKLEVNLSEIFRKELSIKNSFLNPFTFGRAIELILNEKIKFDQFNIERVNIDELRNVFDHDNKLSALKYQFHNN